MDQAKQSYRRLFSFDVYRWSFCLV